MDIFTKFYQYFESGFRYIFNFWERVAPFFFEHLRLGAIALVISLVLALPIGIAISRRRLRWLATPTLSFLGILYTLPSLAFLALLVPIFGLNPLNTVIVLVVYCQTMLVRNISLGLIGIDGSIIEAARGMGMSGWQMLWRVELPLAMPVIVAGLRIATLAIISITTVGAWVGANTLGKLFQEQIPRKEAAGIILVVIIALLFDQLYRLIERITGGYRRKQPITKRTAAVNQPSALSNETPAVTG